MTSFYVHGCIHLTMRFCTYSVQILFDPTLSAKRALLCTTIGLCVTDDLSVLIEKRAQASQDVQGEIIAPNDPSFHEQMMKRKRQQRAEQKRSDQ